MLINACVSLILHSNTPVKNLRRLTHCLIIKSIYIEHNKKHDKEISLKSINICKKYICQILKKNDNKDVIKSEYIQEIPFMSSFSIF